MNLRIIMGDLTVEANDLHPIEYNDAASHIINLAVSLTSALQQAETDGST
jgi:hypothetical protein